MASELIRNFMEDIEKKNPEYVDEFLVKEVGLHQQRVNEITWTDKMDKVQEYIYSISNSELDALYHQYI